MARLVKKIYPGVESESPSGGERGRLQAAELGRRRRSVVLNSGVERIAQKIGEEGVEIALAGVGRDAAGCAEETADLLYHLAVLMEAKGFSWDDVVAVLRQRHAA